MCHVLIIEDEAFIAMDLQHLLENAGATSFALLTARMRRLRLRWNSAPILLHRTSSSLKALVRELSRLFVRAADRSRSCLSPPHPRRASRVMRRLPSYESL